MPSIINTNMNSLMAQQNLSTSQSALSTAIERLSSGMQINSAADNAAGYAIAARMTSQINGLTQAAANANDGISLAQTAQGDLATISDDLQTIRTLAVQSANGTNSASDRVSLNAQAQQMVSEIDRVAQSSSFNGVNLLDGSFTNQQFQVGANAGQTITIGAIASARTSALGNSYGSTVTGSTLTANTGLTAAGQFTIQVGAATAVDVFSSSGGVAVNGDAKSLAAAVNASNIAGVSAAAVGSNGSGNYLTEVTAPSNATLTINGIAMTVALTGGVADATTAMNAINANSAATGVTASNASGSLTLSEVDGRNITATLTSAHGGTLGDVGLNTFGGSTTATGTTGTVYSKYNITYSGTSTLTIAGGAAAGVKGVTNVANQASTSTGTALNAISLSTVAGANTAIASVDAAIATVDSTAASLGAYQNRFTSVVTTLQGDSTNLTAARSRIQDTDYAAETASMTRGEILQQAGTAILAQANQLPNQVLSLLK